MLPEGEPGGVIAAARQIAVHGFGGVEQGGRIADHLQISRLADGQIDLGAQRNRIVPQVRP